MSANNVAVQVGKATTPRHPLQYGLLTIDERLCRGGAKDARVGRFKFFLLIVMTLFCNATICRGIRLVAN